MVESKSMRFNGQNLLGDGASEASRIESDTVHSALALDPLEARKKRFLERRKMVDLEQEAEWL